MGRPGEMIAAANRVGNRLVSADFESTTPTHERIPSASPAPGSAADATITPGPRRHL